MSIVRQRLIDHTDIDDALADLCHGLCDHGLSCMRCKEVTAEQVPPPFDELLVHHNHMTTTLHAFHKEPVEVRVGKQEREGDYYRRQIVLALQSTGEVVEFGVVRIDLSFVPQAVREEILAQRVPLGDILISHDILRRIEPRWFIEVSPQCPLYVGLNGVSRGNVYGRVGTIYCDEQPAIELLEIVTGRRNPVVT